MATKKATKKTTTIIVDERLSDYEMICILSPEADDEKLESLIDGISQIITERDGSITEVDRWGKKKLAYPIKRFTDGSYVLTRFKLRTTACKELEAKLEITDEVLRHLLIKLG